MASACLGLSPKNSMHSLKASPAVRASAFNLRNFSSELFRKSRKTVLCFSFPRSSNSFRTKSIPFSNSWTSVVIFSRETAILKKFRFFYPEVKCSKNNRGNKEIFHGNRGINSIKKFNVETVLSSV